MLCVFLVCTVLCGCERVVRGPRDEITMFSWRGELDNGNIVSLVFSGDSAVLRAVNGDYTLDVSGICLVDDEGFVICDEQTEMNYVFRYILHGDCVELSYGDGTITLDKVETADNDP